jgi:hypothetical protein
MRMIYANPQPKPVNEEEGVYFIPHSNMPDSGGMLFTYPVYDRDTDEIVPLYGGDMNHFAPNFNMELVKIGDDWYWVDDEEDL